MKNYPHIWKNRRGFTLVEVVVALTLFSFVALGLGASFFSAMKIYSRAQDAAENNILLAVESLASQLRQSLNNPDIGFSGSSNEVTFASLKKDSIVKLVYSFEAEEKKFSRKETALSDVLLAEQQPAQQETEAVPQVLFQADEASLSYLYYDLETQAYGWKDAWDKTAGVFSALKLSVKAKNQQFTKIIYVPLVWL